MQTQSPRDQAEPALLSAGQVVQDHKPVAPRAASGVLGWVALCVALLALLGLLAVGLLLAWFQPRLSEQQQRLDQLTQESNRLDGRVNILLGQIETGRAEQQSQLKLLGSQLAAAEQRLDALAAAQQQLNHGDIQQQLRLTEVEHLLRLANDQLLAGRPPQLARQLLKEADLLLVEFDDPSLRPLRAALASDLAALDSYHPPDIEGYFVRLAARVEQIGQLPLRGVPSLGDRSASTQTATPPVRPGWRGWLDPVWAQLRQLVVIRQRQQPVDPLLSQTQALGLRQQLQLQLQQAQLAMLRGQEQIYRASLDSVISTLDRQFDSEAAEVVALTSALRELAQQSITTVPPTLDGSLQAVRMAIRTQAVAPAPAVDAVEPGAP